MKNLNQTISRLSERKELIHNLKGMTDDVMILRQRILKEEGFTKSGLFVMYYVSSKGPLKLTDCSTNLGVSKPTVTKIVDTLEKDGLVERRKKEGDRRTYYVHLTDRGKKRMSSLNRRLEEVFSNATRELRIEAVRDLNSSMNTIRDKLRLISNHN